MAVTESAGRKNIWILHHYADPPDGHWSGTFDLYKPLADHGHAVTVFSSSFSHYTRTESRLLPQQAYGEKYFGGVRFVFVRTPPYARNDWRRIVNMLAFGYRAYRAASRLDERPDVIVGSTPHPFCTFAACLLAQKYNVPFFLELHDLWLEYMLDTGMLSKKNPLAFCLEWLDRYCYKRARKIMALWPDMYRYLARFNVPENKVVWTPMGLDVTVFKAARKSRKTADGLITVACTARFGPASNVDEILEAAKILQEKGESRIRFSLFGSGPEKDNLLRYAEQNHLRHVQFPGMLSKEQIPEHLVNADICIGGLPDIPCYARFGTIPTKMLDYLASGNPTVYITRVSDCLVERAGAGIVVPPGNPGKLAEAITTVAKMTPEERAEMGARGMRYLEENHDLSMLAARGESLLFEEPCTLPSRV